MGNKESTQNLQPKDLKELKSSTSFSEKELKQWYKDFLSVSVTGWGARFKLSTVGECDGLGCTV